MIFHVQNIGTGPFGAKWDVAHRMRLDGWDCFFLNESKRVELSMRPTSLKKKGTPLSLSLSLSVNTCWRKKGKKTQIVSMLPPPSQLSPCRLSFSADSMPSPTMISQKEEILFSLLHSEHSPTSMPPLTDFNNHAIYFQISLWTIQEKKMCYYPNNK